MSRYLVPATRENLETSIEQEVDPRLLSAHLPEKAIASLLVHSGAEGLHCWAMTDSLRSQFDAMKPGDLILLSEKNTKRFTHSGQVADKLQSKSLGDALWPVRGERPWEFIYFLRHIQRINVLKSDLVTKLGYKPNDAVAGTRRVPSERLQRFESMHGPFADWLRLSYAQDEGPDAPSETRDAEWMDYSSMDVLSLRKRRLQHEAFARQVKLNYGKTCDMCDTPEEALVEGHIVAWSEAVQHRLDPSNGLCLCVMHDRAFESGYLVLDDRLCIRAGPLLKPTSTVGRHLEEALGRRIRLPTSHPPNPVFLKRHRDRFALTE